MTEQQDPVEVLRGAAWDEAFHCYGNAFILEQRVKWFDRAFFIHDLLSFGFPLLVGMVALSFGINEHLFKALAVVGSLLGIATMVFSLMSLIGRWRESHQKYLREIVTNSILFDEYRRFGKSPPKNEYRKQFDIMEVRRQESEKGETTFTEEEKRFGYRYAARQFERECAGCSVRPTDMISTDCTVCGKFKQKFQ